MSQRLVILASGKGSTFEALVKASQCGQLRGEVVGLITNNPKAPVLERAKEHSVPTQVIDLKEFSGVDAWDAETLKTLKRYNPDLIILAGFLKKVGSQVLEAYPNRILNTHPSLLPKFSGPGMYGKKVHEAVLSSGEKETGISVHIVTKNYDEGPVLAQCKISVLAQDDVANLEHRVKDAEPAFYIETINKYLKEIKV